MLTLIHFVGMEELIMFWLEDLNFYEKLGDCKRVLESQEMFLTLVKQLATFSYTK